MQTQEEPIIGDANTPVFPEGILPKNELFDYPSYDGDMSDINERKNVKLYNIWNHWSSLRKNENLMVLLNKTDDENEDVKFLKMVMVLTMDRIGKILGDTNMVEELKPTPH